jgi:hypothetical protein
MGRPTRALLLVSAGLLTVAYRLVAAHHRLAQVTTPRSCAEQAPPSTPRCHRRARDRIGNDPRQRRPPRTEPQCWCGVVRFAIGCWLFEPGPENTLAPMSTWTEGVGIDPLVTVLAVALVPAVEGLYALLVRWGVADVAP